MVKKAYNFLRCGKKWVVIDEKTQKASLRNQNLTQFLPPVFSISAKQHKERSINDVLSDGKMGGQECRFGLFFKRYLWQQRRKGDNKIENWIDVIYGWALRHSDLLSAAVPNFELIHQRQHFSLARKIVLKFPHEIELFLWRTHDNCAVIFNPQRKYCTVQI